MKSSCGGDGSISKKTLAVENWVKKDLRLTVVSNKSFKSRIAGIPSSFITFVASSALYFLYQANSSLFCLEYKNPIIHV